MRTKSLRLLLRLEMASEAMPALRDKPTTALKLQTTLLKSGESVIIVYCRIIGSSQTGFVAKILILPNESQASHYQAKKGSFKLKGLSSSLLAVPLIRSNHWSINSFEVGTSSKGICPAVTGSMDTLVDASSAMV
jgi:hypothetical protein